MPYRKGSLIDRTLSCTDLTVAVFDMLFLNKHSQNEDVT